MTKRLILLLSLTGAIAASFAVFLLSRKGDDVTNQDVLVATVRSSEAVQATNANVRLRKGRASKVLGKKTADEDNWRLRRLAELREDLKKLSPEEREIAKLLLSIYNEIKVTPERMRAVRLRQAMDAGDNREILRLARDLMDSPDRMTRGLVLQALGFVGSGALPEITEMLADPDIDLAADAIEQWTMAFDGIENAESKAETLVEMVGMLEERTQIDAILMAVTKMETRTALETVAEIIQTKSGEAREAAYDMYNHLTGGEDYQDANSVEEYLTRKAEEAKQAAEDWQKIRQAAAEGSLTTDSASGDVQGKPEAAPSPGGPVSP